MSPYNSGSSPGQRARFTSNEWDTLVARLEQVDELTLVATTAIGGAVLLGGLAAADALPIH